MSIPTIRIRPYFSDEFEKACEIRELTTDESKQRMKINVENSGNWGDHYLHLAVDRNNELVGDIQLRHCKFSMPPGSADMGIEISKELRGQGIGTLALEALKNQMSQYGLHRISGSTAIDNVGMQKAFEKADWKKEGIAKNLFLNNGVGIDYVVYAISQVGENK